MSKILMSLLALTVSSSAFAGAINCLGVTADGQAASVNVNATESLLTYKVGVDAPVIVGIYLVTDTTDAGLNYLTDARDIKLETNAEAGSVFFYHDQEIQVSCN